LLLFCIASVDFSQSGFEVRAFISDEDLFSEVRPVELGLRFTINGSNDPFKNFIGFRLSIFDLDLEERVGIDFVSNLDSLFPLSKVLLLV
jgi:hypothetical protein